MATEKAAGNAKEAAPRKLAGGDTDEDITQVIPSSVISEGDEITQVIPSAVARGETAPGPRSQNPR